MRFKLFSKDILHKAEEDLAQVGRNPFLDWSIIFFSSVFLAVLFLLFALYVYLQVNNGDFATVPKSKTNKAVTLDREALREIITNFNFKAANYESLKAHPETAVDPGV